MIEYARKKQNDLRKKKNKKKESTISDIVFRLKEKKIRAIFLLSYKFCGKNYFWNNFPIGAHLIKIYFIFQLIFYQSKQSNFSQSIVFFSFPSKYTNPKKSKIFICKVIFLKLHESVYEFKFIQLGFRNHNFFPINFYLILQHKLQRMKLAFLLILICLSNKILKLKLNKWRFKLITLNSDITISNHDILKIMRRTSIINRRYNNINNIKIWSSF